ncbi:hypothetical protein [Mycobacterium sp.]|uniref:hypothetical protein n=1 Tax=Mycobacterium sp. TaxID=1785 RepID=UPI002639E199|nr:hypothetical protein [Mycobacterium sp.]
MAQLERSRLDGDHTYAPLARQQVLAEFLAYPGPYIEAPMGPQAQYLREREQQLGQGTGDDHAVLTAIRRARERTGILEPLTQRSIISPMTLRNIDEDFSDASLPHAVTGANGDVIGMHAFSYRGDVDLWLQPSTVSGQPRSYLHHVRLPGLPTFDAFKWLGTDSGSSALTVYEGFDKLPLGFGAWWTAGDTQLALLPMPKDASLDPVSPIGGLTMPDDGLLVVDPNSQQLIRWGASWGESRFYTILYERDEFGNNIPVGRRLDRTVAETNWDPTGYKPDGGNLMGYRDYEFEPIPLNGYPASQVTIPSSFTNAETEVTYEWDPPAEGGFSYFAWVPMDSVRSFYPPIEALGDGELPPYVHSVEKYPRGASRPLIGFGADTWLARSDGLGGDAWVVPTFAQLLSRVQDPTLVDPDVTAWVAATLDRYDTESDYLHGWQRIVADTGEAFYLVRHGWTHLRGWITGNVGINDVAAIPGGTGSIEGYGSWRAPNPVTPVSVQDLGGTAALIVPDMAPGQTWVRLDGIAYPSGG